LNAPAKAPLRLRLDDQSIDVTLSTPQGKAVAAQVGEEVFFAQRTAENEVTVGGSEFAIAGAGDHKIVFEAGAAFLISAHLASGPDAPDAGGDTMRAPMPGRIVSVGHAVGSHLKQGETVLTLEAMKMEHALKAQFDGVLVELNVQEGDQVTENSVLARLEPVA
jgi:biotin carboxyl carrier protein